MKEGLCIGCICAGIALIVAGISLAILSKKSDESYSKLKDFNEPPEVIVRQNLNKYNPHRYVKNRRRRLARGQLYDQE